MSPHIEVAVYRASNNVGSLAATGSKRCTSWPSTSVSAKGEILGLAWNDIDLESGTIRVRQALQRVNSKLELVEPTSVTRGRVVATPRIVLDALRAHGMRQLEARLSLAG